MTNSSLGGSIWTAGKAAGGLMFKLEDNRQSRGYVFSLKGIRMCQVRINKRYLRFSAPWGMSIQCQSKKSIQETRAEESLKLSI